MPTEPDPLWSMITIGQGRDYVCHFDTIRALFQCQFFIKRFVILLNMNEQLARAAEQQPRAIEVLYSFITSKALLHGWYDVQVQVGVPGTDTFQESALFGATMVDTAEGPVLVIEAADATGQIQKYVSVAGRDDLFQHLGAGSHHQIVVSGFKR